MSCTEVNSDALARLHGSGLPRGARLLHVDALMLSHRWHGEGRIPAAVLSVVARDEPDPAAAVAALVDAGLWTETATGWRIVDFDQWVRTPR